MYIDLGFDIEISVSAPTVLIHRLRVHPQRLGDLASPERIKRTEGLTSRRYTDAFGNLAERLDVPDGIASVRLSSQSRLRDSGEPDPVVPDARPDSPHDMALDVLTFLHASRYCEVDSELHDLAWSQFGHTEPGWPRVAAICDFVHRRTRFDYAAARGNRTALETFRERSGLCRDFAHLALTLCRCMDMPARFVTGYLGEIGVPPVSLPTEFGQWFEVWLSGRWHVFDARHNRPRVGRVVMARGRDAGDVPLIWAVGRNAITRMNVITREVT